MNNRINHPEILSYVRNPRYDQCDDENQVKQICRLMYEFFKLFHILISQKKILPTWKTNNDAKYAKPVVYTTTKTAHLVCPDSFRIAAITPMQGK